MTPRVLGPKRLVREIEDAIETSRGALEALVLGSLEDLAPAHTRRPLAIKYIPTRYASIYRAAGTPLRISATEGFTWGTGVYVTPLSDPLSTAIYGRAGIVARYDPANWRVFDARDSFNERLYLAWLALQPLTPSVLLTVHSAHFLQQLRNRFREVFHIDCVLFHPDEIDRLSWYTTPSDTWMAVSDWDGPDLAQGDSARFQDARLTVLTEEEFSIDEPAVTRSPMLALSGATPLTPDLAARICVAYRSMAIERVTS